VAKQASPETALAHSVQPRRGGASPEGLGSSCSRQACISRKGPKSKQQAGTNKLTASRNQFQKQQCRPSDDHTAPVTHHDPQPWLQRPDVSSNAGWKPDTSPGGPRHRRQLPQTGTGHADRHVRVGINLMPAARLQQHPPACGRDAGTRLPWRTWARTWARSCSVRCTAVPAAAMRKALHGATRVGVQRMPTGHHQQRVLPPSRTTCGGCTASAGLHMGMQA
jgi:hypothetical protein